MFRVNHNEIVISESHPNIISNYIKLKPDIVYMQDTGSYGEHKENQTQNLQSSRGSKTSR